MPSNVTTTTYLQVPKFVPHRSARSKSRSRGTDIAAPQPVRVRRSSPPPIPRRMGTPPPKLYPNGISKSPEYSAPTNGVHTNGSHPFHLLNGESLAFHSEDLNGDFYTLAPSPSPPPELPLRQRLIGAWRLETYVAYPTPSSPIQRPTFPMTKNVTGLILYTPDGYMSAQMLIPGQQSFKRGEGEEAQWAEAGKRCFSYAGPYYISNEGSGREEILRHTFQICNLPGWIGDVQVRTWKFEDDGNVLVLGSEEPTEIKGDHRIPVLKWRRVTNNCGNRAPPPMPQIKVSGPGEP